MLDMCRNVEFIFLYSVIKSKCLNQVLYTFYMWLGICIYITSFLPPFFFSVYITYNELFSFFPPQGYINHAIVTSFYHFTTGILELQTRLIITRSFGNLSLITGFLFCVLFYIALLRLNILIRKFVQIFYNILSICYKNLVR